MMVASGSDRFAIGLIFGLSPCYLVETLNDVHSRPWFIFWVDVGMARYQFCTSRVEGVLSHFFFTGL